MAKKLILVEGEKFARKCSVTGEGMNEGWIAEYSGEYFKYEEDAKKWCLENGFKTLKQTYKDGDIYWTEWDAKEDAEYVIKNGKVVEIEEENTAEFIIIQKDLPNIEINNVLGDDFIIKQGEDKMVVDKKSIKLFCAILMKIENE